MSEKRFIFATNEKWFLFDNEDEEYMDMEDCKDKLNEQQATINKLQEELELTAKNKLFSRRKLEEENEQLRQELEQLKKVK